MKSEGIRKKGSFKGIAILSVIAMMVISSCSVIVFSAPGMSSVSADNGNASKSSTITQYSITFTETGLPRGATGYGYTWHVILNGVTERTSGTSITFNETDGTYHYSVGSTYNYFPVPSSGTVIVSGSNKNVLVNFHSKTYLVTFNVNDYSSVTGGTSALSTWSVNFDGMNNTTQSSYVEFLVQNGTYSYSVTAPHGYFSAPATGSITVSGSNVIQNLTFNNTLYQATFVESGLPKAASSNLVTEWKLNVSGPGLSTPLVMYSNSSEISFFVPAGKYTYSVSSPFGFSSNPVTGSFTVTNASISESVHFSSLYYNLVFRENGLPSKATVGQYGTEWGVQITNSTNGKSFVQYSSNQTVSFYVDRGNYTFSVLKLNDYRPSVKSGYVNVTDNSYLVPISFTAINYTLKFTEKSLPVFSSNGRSVIAEWSVTVTNSTSKSYIREYSNTSTLSFLLPGGSYSFAVSTLSGYTVFPRTGVITLSSNTNVIENFTNTSALTSTSSNSTVVFVESGLPASTHWTVGLNNTSGASSFSTNFQDNVITVHTGTYFYSIPSVGSYYPTVISGIIDLSTVREVNVTFVNGNHPLVFKENGLPYNTTWSVALSYPSGQTYVESTQTGSLMFSVPNGTYTYRLVDTGFYHPQLNQGTVTVNGTDYVPSNLTTVNFVSDATTLTFQESGLPAYTQWTASIATSYGNIISKTSIYGTISFTVQNSTYRYFTYTVGAFHPKQSSGVLSASGKSVTTAFSFYDDAHTVTFNEQGLPSGTTWSVYLGGMIKSSLTGSNITFTVGNGSYYYMVEPSGNYLSSASSGSLYMTGKDTTVNVSYAQRLFDVTVQESGLSTGTFWSFSLAGKVYGTNQSSMVLQKENGSYIFNTIPVANHNPVPSDSLVRVAGTSQVITVAFHSEEYNVTFNELNLSSGTQWGVLISGSGVQVTNASTSLTFNLTNGTYSFMILTSDNYVSTPASGTLYVNGTSMSESITFRLYIYTAVFKDTTSLPSGDTWYVNLTSDTGRTYALNSTSSTIEFSLLNGTYSYTVASENKTVSSPTSGQFTINGAGTSVSVSFAPVYYGVTLKESGLPKNTTWYVTLGGVNHTVSTSNITFNLVNGTYTFNLVNINGYNVTEKSVNVTVKGANSTTFVTFKPVTKTVYVPPKTIPATVPLNSLVVYILIAISAIGLLVIFIVYTKGRRK